MERFGRDEIALQAFSDGGLRHGNDAAASVVTCVAWDGGQFHSFVLAVKGVYMISARSACHAEVTALDLAVDFLHKLDQRR